MQLAVTIDGKKYVVDVEVEEGEEVRMAFPDVSSTIQARPAAPVAPTLAAAPPVATPASDGYADDKVCRSPIAGVVFKIICQVGQVLQADDLLVVLEAMKMETNITAHVPGKVKKILVTAGEAAKPGQALVEFE
jgi:methylmalonyl-CoA carboxyltransferase 1.3S subunit